MSSWPVLVYLMREAIRGSLVLIRAHQGSCRRAYVTHLMREAIRDAFREAIGGDRRQPATKGN